MTNLVDFFIDLAKCIRNLDKDFKNRSPHIRVKSPKKSISNITIGYIYYPKTTFVSSRVFLDNFMNQLSDFVKVITIPIDLAKDDFGKLKELNIDYFYADISNFSVWPFVLRERHQIDIPFLIILHTVYDWARELTCIIPLIKEEDVIIAPSDYAKLSFLKISRKFNPKVIPHCLDIRNIQNSIANLPKVSRKTITFLGRLIESKGIGVLIQCMPEIIQKVGNVHLNIIGPLSGSSLTNYPKSSYVKYLEKQVRELGLSSNVHFRGIETGLTKYVTLAESDLLVNPTTYLGETFTIVNLEAMAAGLPVVTTEWAANAELIKEGKNGYLVDVHYSNEDKPSVDTRQLIFSIVKILTNKELNQKMKMYSRKTALKYDCNKLMPQLIKLLKKARITGKDRWDLIKDKQPKDFKNLYEKRMLFYFSFLDWHKVNYSQGFNAIANGFVAEEKKSNLLSTGSEKKAYKDLWEYLCKIG